MKKGWEYKAIKDVAEVFGGTTPSTSNPSFWNGNLPWISPAELKGDKYIYDSVKKITEAAVRDKSLKLLPIDSVILSSRAPIGKVAINKIPLYFNQGFKNIVCGETINPEYLYWWLWGNTEYLNSLGTGATFKEISKKVVENIIIPVPPLPEQEEIVRYLDSAFEKIDELKKNAEQQLTESKALFQKALTEYLTPKKGWDMSTIGEVCVLKSGDSSANKLPSGLLPYVKVGDMNYPGNEIAITTSSTYVDRNKLSPNKVFPIGTTIFPKRGGAILTNKKKMLNIEACCDLNIMGVIPKSNVISQYIYYFFLSVDLRDLYDGASIPQLNNSNIAPLSIPLPPLSEQQAIVAKLDTISAHCRQLEENYRQTITLCDDLKQKILKQIFE